MTPDRVVVRVALLLLVCSCSEPRPAQRSSSPDAPPALATSGPAQGALRTVLLEGVPFVAQKPDFCGEACVEMAARRLGKSWDQDAVFAATGVDPALGRGAFTQELVRGVRALGFEPGAVWSTIAPADPGPGLDAAFAEVVRSLEAGVPSILCMHYDERPDTTEHFRLIVGYDKARDEVVYHEPAEKDGAYRRMPRARLFALWPLKYKPDAWTLIRIPLAPGALVDPPSHAPGGFTPAAYAQHVLALKERLADKGLGALNVRIEAPFVVVGDAQPDALKKRAETVRWAADKLEADFFDARPTRILDVYLFEGKRSYERGVGLLTEDPPDTPYGFYSSDNNGLFMNIATGGGTLVHEIVHPYVEADFTSAPAWLNEGLGSLFEQSAERDGHIVGLTNWRLAGLQRAIKKGEVPSFAELTGLSHNAFYNEDRGTNYAQSRYLLYYLQEKGLLVPFYKAFRKARATDPTGYATLVSALGERDMKAFQARWQDWVLTLSFP